MAPRRVSPLACAGHLELACVRVAPVVFLEKLSIGAWNGVPQPALRPIELTRGHRPGALEHLVHHFVIHLPVLEDLERVHQGKSAALFPAQFDRAARPHQDERNPGRGDVDLPRPRPRPGSSLRQRPTSMRPAKRIPPHTVNEHRPGSAHDGPAPSPRASTPDRPAPT